VLLYEASIISVGMIEKRRAQEAAEKAD